VTAPARRSDDAPRHALPPGLIHDLRTPLGQIIGYTELLVERAEDDEGKSLVPDLQKVKAAGYRMLRLIEDNFFGIRAATPAAEADPAEATEPIEAKAPAEPRSGAVRVPLARFILDNTESILAEWEAFARTCTPASGGMDIISLRDHAAEMLTVIAADLGTAQGGDEQSEKSKGNAPALAAAAADTAAEEHGADRAGSGFTIEQMVSEYRALRASVIRLWTQAHGELTPADVDDLTRFNEAIDQSLAESVSRYTEELDNSKEMFLAILGHDLRTPLGVVFTSARFMLDTGELAEPHLTLMGRIASSSTRMVHMVGDLLDFTRSRLGGGIPIVRGDVSMGKVVHEVVDELAALHPERPIEVHARGEERGEWDAARIAQVLGNLVGNALEHGSEGTPVTVTVGGGDEEITVAVHNRGPAIPPEQLKGIFHPMKPRESTTSAASGPSGSLGLGLYIAERIVHAHAGTIEVASDAGGTTFTVHLPRTAPAD
jgi:signal transduction histidine kinase